VITGGSRPPYIVYLMKNLFSTGILVAALALLVPNNAAEAVVTHLAAPLAVSTLAANAGANRMSAVNEAAPDPSTAWLISLGFLGLIATRRLRGD